MNEKTLLSIIEKVKNGFQVERSNLDLKRRWWHLDKTTGQDEFLKDICSMSNAQGGDSYIILGVDESGELYDAPMPDDEANIQQRHKDQIEPRVKLHITEYNIENKVISVITIPHSHNRPHVIKKYQDYYNWIPLRFGSTTLTASRSDLDEMYEERDKSNEADIQIRLFEEKIRWGDYPAYRGCCFLVRLSIDNYGGGAPDYIVKAELRQSDETQWRSQHFIFEGQDLDQELRIGQHERKQAVQLYLSDTNPKENKANCNMPSMSGRGLRLGLYTRSGYQVSIPIRSEWVVEK